MLRGGDVPFSEPCAGCGVLQVDKTAMRVLNQRYWPVGSGEFKLGGGGAVEGSAVQGEATGATSVSGLVYGYSLCWAKGPYLVLHMAAKRLPTEQVSVCVVRLRMHMRRYIRMSCTLVLGASVY